jgi:hypothetical protein
MASPARTSHSIVVILGCAVWAQVGAGCGHAARPGVDASPSADGGADRVEASDGSDVADAVDGADAVDVADAVDGDPDAHPPSVSDNPPVPQGWRLMQQSEVTPEMTAWAVSILNDPVDYPMFSTATQTFGGLMVLARVEWHPPDFQNDVVHRGVTLYEPTAP